MRKITRTPSLAGKDTLFRWRLLKDRIARHAVAIGGLSVIFFIALIFFYLAYVVVPVFKSAEIEKTADYAVPGKGQTVGLAVDEQMEIGARFTAPGDAVFFRLRDGSEIKQSSLIPVGSTARSFYTADRTQGLVVYGLDDGRVVVARHSYASVYDNEKRSIHPRIDFPLGETPLVLDPKGLPITSIAFQDNDNEATFLGVTSDERLVLLHITKEVSFLDDELTLTESRLELPRLAHNVEHILLDKTQHRVYLIARNGQLTNIDLSDKERPQVIQHMRVAPQKATVTSVSFLTGHISLIIGDSTGAITQWSSVRQDDNINRLVKIRQFHENATNITAISTEHMRKGFLSGDRDGNLGIFHTTSERTVLHEAVSSKPITQLAVAPRANGALFETDDGQMHVLRIENNHPEVSWSALWGKVWYENYSEPDYIWQASSASDDFEPKLSLVPLTFGTIKAAFYAMLLAVPLSLMGALYTAQFMARGMRGYVKPTIEIMEALPTVILGFLAGLWLAPFVEQHMPGIFSILVVTPIGILAVAFFWEYLPQSVKNRFGEGWEAALLIPVIVIIAWIAVKTSPMLETMFFGGDMRMWLTTEMGVGFDQRNAIVVGLAMGFAVIPTIFSIAEDAIFGVPKHLIQGSLAVGATAWQTMIRVVLLTASPGIFSAIMIGMGRAVGETMIVLMATGNTPVMDFSPFEGLRTLSANIAVELPETEVNSTHFRVLFFAGLVLFLFTFCVNTLAELVRQNLRRRYSTL